MNQMNQEIESLNEKLDGLSGIIFPKVSEALNEVAKILAVYGITFSCQEEYPEEELIFKLEVEGAPKQYYLYIAINSFLNTEIYAQLVDDEELNSLLEMEPEELTHPRELLVPVLSRFLRQTRRTSDD
jgi:hypothetical protein